MTTPTAPGPLAGIRVLDMTQVIAGPLGCMPLRSTVKAVVGLFGAIEIRNINGPLLVDQHYTTGGKVIAVGQSPKTEYYWYETWADDASGRRIAEHRMLTRFMKASSPEYREAPAG